MSWGEAGGNCGKRPPDPRKATGVGDNTRPHGLRANIEQSW